jgi:melibiose permease
MENNTLPLKSKISYGLGAVGKDMVYMLSASYVLYYFQDLLGVSAAAMGVILMAARIFDAFNDPLMGVIVAKTNTRWGRFRPWLLIGTLTNAVILVLMFAAPPALDGPGLVAYAAITYILWGVTYTMMDIPYWSMIPAFTKGGKERENLTTLARSCAGVGSAIITITTMMAVPALGRMFGPEGANATQIEIAGFKYFTIGVAAFFILFTVLTCINIKEKPNTEMKATSVKEMLRALVQNDQAMAVTIAIVLINGAVYITSNLVIYFFKYDFGGVNWYGDYTLFNTFGGAVQILSMMVLYPLLRKRFTNLKIFYVALGMAALGYISLLALAFTSMDVVYLLFIPGFLIFAANGVLTVLTTVFLANTVDYGELKNHRRDESVIFSMQTFVVKLASGVAIFIASMALQFLNLKADADSLTEADKVMDFSAAVSNGSKAGLRMVMTLIPIVGLIAAYFYFKKKFTLTDERTAEIAEQVRAMHEKEKKEEA